MLLNGRNPAADVRVRGSPDADQNRAGCELRLSWPPRAALTRSGRQRHRQVQLQQGFARSAPGCPNLTQRRAQRAEAVDLVNVADASPTPEVGLVREQQGARLRRAVHSLPLLYRQVVTLMLEDMEYDEIAQVLGISESNVGARLSRARQMLRESMEVSR